MKKQIVVPVIVVLTIGTIVMGYFLWQQTNKLGEAEAEIVALERNVVVLQTNLAESEATVSTLETKLTAANTKIVALERNVVALQTKLAEIKLELGLVWRAQMPLWLIEGQVSVREGCDFHMKLDPLLNKFSSFGRYYLLVTRVEEYLERERMREHNVIFLISPAGLEAMIELARKHPEFLPLPYNELKLYSPPFMYAVRDQETGMIRVLIIAHQVPDSLAKLLIEGVSLETPIPLEGNIVALQKKLPEPEPEPDPIQDPVVELEPTLVWKAQLPLWVIGGQVSVRGIRDLHMELGRLFVRASLLGGHPLVTGVERHLESIRASNTIFLISPDDLEALTELARKYPELLPLSYNELKLYSPPFMYVARDQETGMIRVLVIAHQVPDSLAKLLTEGVFLETPIPLEGNVVALQKKLPKPEPEPEPEPIQEPIFDGQGPRKGVRVDINMMEFFVALQGKRYEVAERYLTPEFAVQIEAAGGLEKISAAKIQGRRLARFSAWILEVPEEHRVENIEQIAVRAEIGFGDETRKELFIVSRLVEGVWLIEYIKNWGK